VLDGEGYDVVAEASTTAELARLMATHRPDVVVLDDGIGATAVGMINEMSPNTRVVLVWPGAVMPIGGAARVEPSRVLQDLGPTVERLTGQPSATGSGRGSELLENAANDPEVLRAMLLGGVRAGEPIIEDREPAPVVILPLTPTIDHGELILNVPEAEPADDERSGVAGGVGAAAAAGAILSSASPAAASDGPPGVTSLAGRRRTGGAQSALNRRLGNLALGGAAVASALVLALALGGTRVPVGDLDRAQQAPVTSSPNPGPTDTPEPGQETDGGQPNGNQGGPENTGTAGPADLAVTPVVNDGGSAPPPPPSVDPAPDPGGNGGPPDGGGNIGGGGDDHGGGDSGAQGGGGGSGRGGNGGTDGNNGGSNDGSGDDSGGATPDTGAGADSDDPAAHGDVSSGPASAGPAEGGTGDAGGHTQVDAASQGAVG
jgi:hypothetical protein